ncbi:NUDIX hydrolase domain-like protein [Kickxella alabastrina]|uniref:NUDIX hydrolase domain-like protein n=1 Tax=Kickxella alabastrina TaxID=61397 RepID=UPI00221F7B78|nr:NUDIX hydrolase domain-like protein [Kickxella alabastrina]KAI7823412.1 NUDIX hydrolase domain-like protein [Kickxella alabastrina]
MSAANVRHNGQVLFLLGKRHGSHGENTWGLPGGHLELGESWASCAEREVLEECGIQIQRCRFVGATNDVFDPASMHYPLTSGSYCDNGSGNDNIAFEQRLPEVGLMEPDKCLMWAWVSWSELVARKAVLRDACSSKACNQLEAEEKHDNTGLDLSSLFLPLLNLERQYGAQGPSWLNPTL